ncbi:zinc-regulated transporter 1 [Fusarium tjaetaba]|uniref:Zinc-regulated transporter 1 n=1 Tax=Fusarium tjaetaba TaxID=1567544 RepID=A0A8H5RUQ7_9HYPO|nr:zinc-regulated transporter 1 [Fusarium tjaetaba]KAF5641740.1 zinc-regulated transporter 1 [Fusarium tjaetaba]
MSGPTNFDPERVNLTEFQSVTDQGLITCFLTTAGNQYDGPLGIRIGSLFVILVVSTAVTFFPVVATRIPRLKIPLYVYLFARYFGSGVIIATAFVHLLDPAYSEIGPASCVGMTGGWSTYSWPPAIALSAAMFTFLFDFSADYYVQSRYGLQHNDSGVEETITTSGADGHQHHSDDGSNSRRLVINGEHDTEAATSEKLRGGYADFKELQHLDGDSEETELAFKTQIAAFLILEFGVLFHSVFIGLNLGVADTSDFDTLFPVLVFHQSFEGLGIGARLSAIPFPNRLRSMPWLLCLAYGLTTPIAIAVGLGIRKTYDNSSFTANTVNGIFDSISAGILIYTGFVEMIARDFLFNRERTNDKVRLGFMIVCLFLGAGIMALVGKWA